MIIMSEYICGYISFKNIVVAYVYNYKSSLFLLVKFQSNIIVENLTIQ